MSLELSDGVDVQRLLGLLALVTNFYVVNNLPQNVGLNIPKSIDIGGLAMWAKWHIASLDFDVFDETSIA
jgi:hypothetical protein